MKTELAEFKLKSRVNCCNNPYVPSQRTVNLTQKWGLVTIWQLTGIASAICWMGVQINTNSSASYHDNWHALCTFNLGWKQTQGEVKNTLYK